MSRTKRSPRRLPCEVCGQEVVIQDRSRFLRMVREDASVRCERCGRYVLPGTARVSQLSSEHIVTALGLRRKRGPGAKRAWSLESCPLGRCGR